MAHYGLGRSDRLCRRQSARQTGWGTFHCSRKANIPCLVTASPSFPISHVAGPKVSKARIKANDAKFSRYFKGTISIGNVRVRSLHGQPATHSTTDSEHRVGENPAFYVLSVRS